MDGTISSCGFRSGDRFVVGAWRVSPVGYHAQSPAWLTDGRTIVFSGFVVTKGNRSRVLADQAVETNLYSIDLDGNNLKELIRNAMAPSLSR